MNSSRSRRSDLSPTVRDATPTGSEMNEVFVGPSGGSELNDTFNAELLKFSKDVKGGIVDEDLTEIEELRRENEMLRQYSSRCEDELRQYQLQFPDLLEEIAYNYADHVEHALTPWVTSGDILNPLLIAYEQRIHSLTTSKHTTERKLTAANEKIKVIQNQLDSIEEELAEYHSLRIPARSSGPNAMQDVYTDEHTNLLLEKINVLQKTNHSLTRQQEQLHPECEAWKTKFAECQQLTEQYKDKQSNNAKMIGHLKQTYSALLKELNAAKEKALDVDKLSAQVHAFDKKLLLQKEQEKHLQQTLESHVLENVSIRNDMHKIRVERDDLQTDVQVQAGNLRELERIIANSKDTEISLLQRVEVAENLREEKARELATVKQTADAHKVEIDRLHTKEQVDISKLDAVYRAEKEEMTVKYQNKVHLLETELHQTYGKLNVALTDLDLERRSLKAIQSQVSFAEEEQEQLHRDTGRIVADATRYAVELEARTRESELQQDHLQRHSAVEKQRLTKELHVAREECSKLQQKNVRLVKDWRSMQEAHAESTQEQQKSHEDAARLRELLEGKVSMLEQKLVQVKMGYEKEMETIRTRAYDAEHSAEVLIGEAKQVMQQQQEVLERAKREHTATLSAMRNELIRCTDQLNETKELYVFERNKGKKTEYTALQSQMEAERVSGEQTRLMQVQEHLQTSLTAEREKRLQADSTVNSLRSDVKKQERARVGLENQLVSSRVGNK